MTDEHPERPGPENEPERERAPEGERVADAEWEEFVAGIREQTGFVPEMSRDEVREALEDADDWHPPEPAPIGWRTAAPAVVLAWVAVLGGLTAVVVGAVFFRPIPGWATLALIVVVLLGALTLFIRLPRDRKYDGGDGAEV